MNSCKNFLVLVFLMLTFSSLATAGDEFVKNGVVHVVNSDVPVHGAENIHLTELWRVGGEGDESIIFGAIDKVILARDGNLYVLDGKSSLVSIHSMSDGRQLRVIDISGEGPGELNFASNMFLLGEDQIGLLRHNPAKIVCIDYRGLPGKSVDLYGNNIRDLFQAGHADYRDGTFVLDGQNSGEGQIFLARYSCDGEVFRYESYPMKSSPAKRILAEQDGYFMTSKPWTIGLQGDVYMAPNWADPRSGAYSINVYNASGQIKRVITRQFVSWKRSGTEKKDAQFRFLGDAAGVELFEKRDGGQYLVEDYAQDVVEIHTHHNGDIWVHNSRSVNGQPEGVIISYDVFSPEGHFIRQISLLGDGNGEKDMLYHISLGRVILVKGQVDFLNRAAEAEELEIICYSTDE